MIKLTVTVQVNADVDGWAKAMGVTASVALIQVLAYLRDTDPTSGQTFLSLAEPTTARMDLKL